LFLTTYEIESLENLGRNEKPLGERTIQDYQAQGSLRGM